MTIRLGLRQPPDLRLDVRGLLPGALVGLDAAAIARLPISQGRHALPLGEFFDVVPQGEGDSLELEGDLSRCDRIGWQLAAGSSRARGLRWRGHARSCHHGCGPCWCRLVCRACSGLHAGPGPDP